MRFAQSAPLCLSTLALLLVPAAAFAQFESVSLTPGFDPDPVTASGISGGPSTAADVLGTAESLSGPCLGFIDVTPDHRVTLTADFTWLAVGAEPEDGTTNLTLVVSSPEHGVWCNDDTVGSNPEIAGAWPAGTYSVWVGNYTAGEQAAYRLWFTQVEGD